MPKAKLFDRTVDVLGSIGDCNPLDYSGGFVYEDEDGIYLVWIEPEDDNDEDDAMVDVYETDVPENVMHEYPEMWEKIITSAGHKMSTPEYESAFAANADPMKRTLAIWDLANYWGWHPVASAPIRMRRSKAKNYYDAALDAAKKIRP